MHQHFGDELRRREETLMECQSRIHEATQALHLLRYLAVAAYYSTKVCKTLFIIVVINGLTNTISTKKMLDHQ